MRCVIPGRSVKCESLKARFDGPLFAFLSFFSRFCLVFAKAIHCLSRIGDELYLEALPQGVCKYN